MPALLGVDLNFQHYDLSLERRRATNNQVVEEAAEAILATWFGLKAATITPEGVEDVGSPNLLLRERLGAHVIVRTGRRIPGVTPLGGVHGPITVVRMAVGEVYGAKEWREGQKLEEVACRTERITRRHCRAVAEYAFRHAEQSGDFFSCGTCGGVGQGTNTFLKVGDVMETEIELLGKMRNKMVAAA